MKNTYKYSNKENVIILSLDIADKYILGLPIEKILDYTRGFWITQVLMTAIDLDIFTILNSKPLTAFDIAKASHTDIRALSMLLDALASLELLQKIDNHLYRNTHNSSKYLVKTSSNYIGWLIHHHHLYYITWDKLKSSIISGKPSTSAMFFSPNREDIANYCKAMHARALLEANEVISYLPFTKEISLHILDLGGGPGTFAIRFCQEYPNIKATVFDLPDVIFVSKEIISSYEVDVQNRITLIAGNFETDNLGENIYDVIFMSNILHALSHEEIEALFKKCYTALKKNGTLIIRDMVLSNDRTSPLDGSLLSLNMLLTSERGQVYTIGDFQKSLTKNGFTTASIYELTGYSDIILSNKAD